MCYIVFAPSGKKIEKDWLIAAKPFNPDGFGFSLVENDQILTFKTLDFDEFMEGIDLMPIDCDRLVHMRFATKGEVSIDNVQPIEMKDRVIAHNGTIPGFGNKAVSDSRDFAEKVLASLSLEDILKKKKDIEEFLSWSKIVIMEKERTFILNESKGGWKNGCWHSDPSYASYKEEWSDSRYWYSDPSYDPLPEFSSEDLVFIALSKLEALKRDYPFISKELEGIVELLETSLEV